MTALPVDYAVGGYQCVTTDKIYFALQRFGFNHAAYFPTMFCMVCSRPIKTNKKQPLPPINKTKTNNNKKPKFTTCTELIFVLFTILLILMCAACLQYFQVIHMCTFFVLCLSVWSVGMNSDSEALFVTTQLQLHCI